MQEKKGKKLPWFEASPIEGMSQRESSILDAAIKVFTTKGYDGSRTKDIAKEAGVSEATIFKYFPSKKDIFSALAGPFIEKVAKPLFLRPVTALIKEMEGKSLREKITAIVTERIGLFKQHGKFIGTLAIEAVRHPEMLDVVGERMIPAIVTIFDEIFSAEKKAGRIKDIDSRTIARTALSIVGGYVLLSGLYPATFRARSENEEIETMVDIMLDGLEVKEGQ